MAELLPSHISMAVVESCQGKKKDCPPFLALQCMIKDLVRGTGIGFLDLKQEDERMRLSM